jgi:hypothetical protein
MAIGFVVPEVRLPSHLLYLFSHSCSSAIHLTEYLPFPFSLYFYSPKITRSCPIKLSSPPINHTFNVSAL